MIRPLYRLAWLASLILVGSLIGLLVAGVGDALDLPGAVTFLAAVALGPALYLAARWTVALWLARRARRRHAQAVEARLAEVRELKAPGELPRTADPTPGTVRRARQTRGKRTPRARKRRTGRWG